MCREVTVLGHEIKELALGIIKPLHATGQTTLAPDMFPIATEQVRSPLMHN